MENRAELTAKEELFPYQDPLIDTLGAKEANGEINCFLRVKIPAGKNIDIGGIPELGEMPCDGACFYELKHGETRGMGFIITKVRQKRLAVFFHF